ncbi:MAG: carbohydrate-binding family 9-like protein [Flavobacterium sp.]
MMKNYNVNCIEKDALIITGKGDGLLWNKADVFIDFVSAWDNKKPEKIEFKALWDNVNIYFCFKVHDNQIHLDKKNDSFDAIANSDRVELFFRTDAALNPYYCLEIDPTPRIMDFKAYPGRNFDLDWKWPKKDLLVKSQIEKNQFTVEIAISIASLKELNLIKDNKIETGIFRAKYYEQENATFEPVWISWINPNTETPDFHTSTAFGVLNLVDK